MSSDQVCTTPAKGPVEAGVGASGPAQEKSSYRQTPTSSALISGSSLVTVAIGAVRTKAMAVLLGPSGFGLVSLYSSILDLSYSVANMGINRSGVRQIAEAASSENSQRIAQTAFVLRRTALVLGLLDAIALAAFSRQISIATFGSGHHTRSMVLLALALFFRVVADSQSALIQGLRHIADLARMGVLGSVLGVAVTIVLVYAFGEQGIAPSLVSGAAVTVVIPWRFTRTLAIPRPSLLTRAQARHAASTLLELELAFMGSGFRTLGAGYIVREILTREIRLNAARFYQSAWALGGLYIGIILPAMGSDFYPRLVTAASNCAECNRLVNEQTHVSPS